MAAIPKIFTSGCLFGTQTFFLASDQFLHCRYRISTSFHYSNLGYWFKLFYLSGLNMMEEILNKEQLAMVPSKTKDAKLKIVGGDFIWILTTRS